jgi:hypothetical protein
MPDRAVVDERFKRAQKNYVIAPTPENRQELDTAENAFRAKPEPRAIVAISEDRQYICVLQGKNLNFWFGRWNEFTEGYERVPVDLPLDLDQDARDVLVTFLKERSG